MAASLILSENSVLSGVFPLSASKAVSPWSNSPRWRTRLPSWRTRFRLCPLSNELPTFLTLKSNIYPHILFAFSTFFIRRILPFVKKAHLRIL